MNCHNYSDEELIQKYHDGQEEIAEYIMEKYKPLVRKNTNYLFLIGGDEDDLIQEGMIGLFKALRDYRGDKEASFSTFANLCIKRQLASALEAANRKKHLPMNNYIPFAEGEGEDGINLEEMVTESNSNPEEIFFEKYSEEEFFTNLEKELSPLERKVLSMYLEGNSYKMIAELMDKSPKAIDNTLQRIRGKIKQLNFLP